MGWAWEPNGDWCCSMVWTWEPVGGLGMEGRRLGLAWEPNKGGVRNAAAGGGGGAEK